jgi:hypothetical protein
MARLLDAIEVGKGLHGKDRETLGKLVHEVENAWRRDERGDHPNNLSDWDELDAGYQEVACLIGEAVANHMFFGDHGAGEPLPDAWLRCLTTGVHDDCPYHERPNDDHPERLAIALYDRLQFIKNECWPYEPKRNEHPPPMPPDTDALIAQYRKKMP